MTAAISTGPTDRDALVADLFVADARSLVRLARIFCDDQTAAEDLVQEAFIRLHRSAATIRDVERPQRSCGRSSSTSLVTTTGAASCRCVIGA